MDIIEACTKGDISYVKEYISNGFCLNIANEMGWTPLTSAIEHEQKEIVNFLLKNGADINFQPNGGWSALHQAVDISIDGTLQTKGDFGEPPTDIIQLLIDNGADINIADMNGETPLDMAKSYQCPIGYVSQKIIDLLEANNAES